MYKSIRDNSTRELKSIKDITEKVNLAEWEIEFEEDINITSTPEQVYDILFDAKKWSELLPHCNEIRMKYEDGYNQEFEMVVIGAYGKLESMRSIRKGMKNRCIEYFQPEPPPALKKHLGKWLITRVGEEVNLKSWHNIILSEEGVKKVLGDTKMQDALEIVKNAIKKNSMSTMQTIKSYLE
jgi:aromatase